MLRAAYNIIVYTYDVIKNLIPERNSKRDKKYLSKVLVIFKLPPKIGERIKIDRIGIKKYTNIFFLSDHLHKILLNLMLMLPDLKLKLLA